MSYGKRLKKDKMVYAMQSFCILLDFVELLHELVPAAEVAADSNAAASTAASSLVSAVNPCDSLSLKDLESVHNAHGELLTCDTLPDTVTLLSGAVR
jgi:hypothetical protein